MKMIEYRRLRRQTRKQVADELQTTITTVYRLETGRHGASAEMLKRIGTWSNGAVTANDLVGARPV